MTRIIFIGFLFSIMITSCDSNKSQRNKIQQIQNNNMDFPNPEENIYNDISFKLSNLFNESYNKRFTLLKEEAFCRNINVLDIYFSIEEFNNSDAESFSSEFNNEGEKIDFVHDHYVNKRTSSLSAADQSIKKEMKINNHNCFIQTIFDNKSYRNLGYLTATMEVKDKYYVFQLIGKAENMGYIYDDFIDILESVE